MTPQQIEAMKLALEALELCNGAETVDGVVIYTDKEITAIKEVLAEHAMREVQRLGQEIEQEPCDMGEMCLGCSPRSADGSCPDAKPSGACDCYKDGFRDGMNEFKECYEEQPVQPEQEPVACDCNQGQVCHVCDPITPPQRKPLTQDGTMEIANQTAGQYWMDEAHIQRFRAAVEAAHGIKENT